MKVLFGTDITKNKKNDKSDGGEFIIRSVPGSMSEKHYEAFEKELDEADKAIRKFKVLQIVGGSLFIFGSVGIDELFNSEGDLSLHIMKEAIFQHSVWFTVLLSLSLIGIWIMIHSTFYTIKISRFDKDDAEKRKTENKMFFRQVLSHLEVPQNAVSVDIICSNYVVKKGEPVLKPVLFGFFNAELKLFSDEYSLFIADIENLYSIRLAEIEKINKYNRKLHLMLWNKDTEHNKGKYAVYNIKRMNEFNYIIKTFYSLDIKHDGETYKMYFPPYELDVIESLTGVKYEEENQ